MRYRCVASEGPKKIMIAVMTGTEYGFQGEKKRSQLMIVVSLRAWSFYFWIHFCWTKLERGNLILVTKERYPLIGYPHLVFCGLHFRSAFY